MANDFLYSNHINYLDDTRPAFAFAGSCENGFPEIKTNLGFSLLTQGAIATVSASRILLGTSFSPPTDPNPLSGSVPNINHHYSACIILGLAAGPALYLTKSVIQETDLFEAYWHNRMGLNLYGDPSLKLLKPGLAINGGAPYATAGGVNLTLSETGTYVQMRLAMTSSIGPSGSP